IETYGEVLRVVSHRAVGGASAHLHDGTDCSGTVDTPGMWPYTEDTADGSFFYLSTDEDYSLWESDVDARDATRVDLCGSGIEDELGGTSQMFLAQLGADDCPGTSVVGIRPDGKIGRYNHETGHGDVLATDIEGAPATTLSLAPGGRWSGLRRR